MVRTVTLIQVLDLLGPRSKNSPGWAHWLSLLTRLREDVGDRLLSEILKGQLLPQCRLENPPISMIFPRCPFRSGLGLPYLIPKGKKSARDCLLYSEQPSQNDQKSSEIIRKSTNHWKIPPKASLHGPRTLVANSCRPGVLARTSALKINRKDAMLFSLLDILIWWNFYYGIYHDIIYI